MDLAALRAQFQALQEQQPQQRISESCCLDVLHLLLREQLLQLIPSCSGKEFITPERLELEIRRALAAKRGRLSLSEFSSSSGYSIEAVTSRAQLLQRKLRNAQIIGDDLIDDSYFQAVAEHAQSILKQNRRLDLSELCSAFSLDANLVRREVPARLDPSLGVELQGQVFITRSFRSTVLAAARGCLRGATAPLVLNTAAQRMALPLDSFLAAASELIRIKEVSGTLEGGLYTPQSFTDAQNSQLQAFFAANDFVSVAAAKGAFGDLWRKRVEQLFPNSLPLQSVVVGEGLVSTCKAALQEALVEGHWMDGETLLPPAVSSHDASYLLHSLLQQLPSRFGNKHIVTGACVFSEAFLATLFDALLPTVEAEAAKSLSAPAPPDPAQTITSGAASRSPPENNAAPDDAWAEALAKLTAKKRAEVSGGADKTPEMQTIFEEICCSVRALQKILDGGETDATKHPLVASLFKVRFLQAVDICIAASASEVMGEDVVVTPETRRQLVSKIASFRQRSEGACESKNCVETSALREALEVMQRRDLEAAASSLKAAAEDSHFFLRDPDKRRFKQLSQEQRIHWLGELQKASSTEGLDVLHAVVNLVSARASLWFWLPREGWAVQFALQLLADKHSLNSDEWQAVQNLAQTLGLRESDANPAPAERQLEAATNVKALFEKP